jgi:hypothetical protein
MYGLANFSLGMCSPQDTNKRPRNIIIPHLSIAAERALNRARIHHHNNHHATATTLTLSQQTHILGATGRAALLLLSPPDDAHHHQAIQRMRHHTWPTLLKRALEAINRRARDALEKRLRLAVRGGVATAALVDALAAHVDRAVDFTDRHSVQADAALVRDIEGSECGRDRPGFGGDAVSQKLRRKNLYIVVLVFKRNGSHNVHYFGSISFSSTTTI